ncbi:MAG: superoxide dismutase family protein [Proteobacteria bacterium]|nr:superoxide dismutase family protein [Pseudomonadota bacterium]
MMTFARSLCLSAVGAALALPALAQSQTAKATLKDAQGKEVGAVELVQVTNGVLLRMALKGAPAGERAFHIHAVGKCEAPFTSAGPHFNPAGHKHGLEAKEGSHAGDMPNLHIPASGDLVIEIANPMVTLAKGQPNSLFDADGSAIVIHAGKDDYKSDPAGNAGDRIICGVITE